MTRNTLTSAKALRAECEAMAAQGYSTDARSSSPG